MWLLLMVTYQLAWEVVIKSESEVTALVLAFIIDRNSDARHKIQTLF
jgi:hypothetical protein